MPTDDLATGPATRESPLRRTPLYERQRDLGAAFYDLSGWTGVHWYGTNADRAREYDLPAAVDQSPAVGVEHLATREHVGLYDMTPMQVVELRGPGVDDYVQYLFSNDMDVPVGRARYATMLDEDGGILVDPVVSHVDVDRWLAVTLIGTEGRDTVDWMRRHAPADVEVVTRDSAYAGVGVWGPGARSLLAGLTDHDVSSDAFPYFDTHEFTVAGIPVTAMRLSFAGELGWELWTPTEYGTTLWDELRAAGRQHGAVPLGVRAVVTMGAEKCYRVWGWDMTAAQTPFEAGLEFTVDMDTDFLGRDALERVARDGVAERFATITVPGAGPTPEGGDDVVVDGAAVGRVVRSEFGYSIGDRIVFAYLAVEHADPGTSVAVQGDGEPLSGVVREEPLFDPSGSRLRQ